MAIEHTLTILTWYENLPNEERPPEYLWEDSKGLDMWFETVAAKREDGSSTSGPRTDHAQDDQGPETAENDHARFLKQAMA